MRLKTYAYTTVLTIALVSIGVAFAAFIDKIKYSGAIFSIANADIKFVRDLTLGADPNNLVDELTGPVFGNIGSNWKSDYLIKIYNAGSQTLQIVSKSNYTTANDPDSLREVIYVEPFEWDDLNNNGSVDQDEKGASKGQKTLLKWKSEGGITLGNIGQGEIKGYILSFSTQTVADTKQGKTGAIDFEFEGIGQ